MTVLIVGRRDDACCQLVDDALRERGVSVAFLPEDRILPGLRFTWRPGETNARMGFEGAELGVDGLSGVLCRSYGVLSSEDHATRDGQYISVECHALLVAWLHALPCQTVVNRLNPMLWYRMRLDLPDLLALVPSLPFAVPHSVVTTRADEAINFCRTIGGAARFSPLTQPARYRIASEEDFHRLESLAGTLPLYLSEWIDGSPIDAYVIGDRVMFTDAAGELVSPPDDRLRERCLAAAATLGLLFYQLSLVRRDDSWYCFGLDRMPRIDAAGLAARIEIAAELADLLLGEARA